MPSTARPRKRRARRSVPMTARTADKHDLYQRSVQSPDVDVVFMSRLFKRMTGRPLRLYREDFCGTAKLSCEFVKLHRENRALGVDLDRKTLEWGRKHNLSQLTEEQQSRVTLVQEDVLEVHKPRADLINAMNFSYCVFKTRDELCRYMQRSLRSLRPGGLLVMDAFGGSTSQEVVQEETRKKGFMYVWDQAEFDPITHHTTCKIHFSFRDGSRIRNAFVYEWRLWTLPEMQELMAEAGFEDPHVLWEGTDSKTNEGNGVFRRVRKGAADPGWIAYVVGARKGGR